MPQPVETIHDLPLEAFEQIKDSPIQFALLDLRTNHPKTDYSITINNLNSHPLIIIEVHEKHSETNLIGAAQAIRSRSGGLFAIHPTQGAIWRRVPYHQQDNSFARDNISMTIILASTGIPRTDPNSEYFKIASSIGQDTERNWIKENEKYNSGFIPAISLSTKKLGTMIGELNGFGNFAIKKCAFLI